MTILDRIAESRLARVAEAARQVPLAELQRRCSLVCGPARDPLGRLATWPRARRAVIAEIKRRSPSKGPLCPGLDPATLARAYRDNGAFAISVLTEPDHFGGSLEDLRSVRAVVDVPVLYKDFVADPYQLWEARANGADLVLLIVALLRERTGEYLAQAAEIGLVPLVEVHDRPELDLALAAGAGLVGINNRNLKTFHTDLAVSRELLACIPAGVRAVSESGLRTPQDLDDLCSHGADAFLIGESLVTQADPGAALAVFVGGAA